MLVKLGGDITVDLAARTVRLGEIEYRLTGNGHDAWIVAGGPLPTELTFRVLRARPASYGWMVDAKEDLARRIGLAWVEACSVRGIEPHR